MQFDPAARGAVDSSNSGAHNASHNGAGVRINQANDILVTHCEIHDNDMGVMSNGKLPIVVAAMTVPAGSSIAWSITM